MQVLFTEDSMRLNVLFGALCALAIASPTFAQEKQPEIVANQGIAFSRVDDDKKVIAYDVVAAYDDHATMVADCGKFKVDFKGVSWCFVSEENRKKFEAAAKERVNPYIPFGGGYCARGLSNGNFAHGDPRTHVRAGPDLIVNGSWSVADHFFDHLTARRESARVFYRSSQRTGLITPNDKMEP